MMNSSDSNNRKRKVRLDLKASKTMIIPSCRDFTADEIESAWWSDEDYKRIQSKTKVVMRMMKKDFNEDDKDYCFRGIQTDEAKQKRAIYRQQAMESLFWEQKRQYMAGITNEEKLRSVLVMCTKAAVDEAVARAQQDRLAALGIDTIELPTVKRALPTQSLSAALAFNTDIVRAPRQPSMVCNQGDLASLLDNVLDILEDPIAA